jgi:hypothetical protein
MTTTQADAKKDLAAKKFEAEVKETDARLKVLEADARARQARAEMNEISGLTAAQARIKQEIAEFKQAAAADYAATKADVAKAIDHLKAGIKRLDARLTVWDEASTRELIARLDKAEAKVAVWKANVAKHQAETGMKRHDQLAQLQESIALARARSAEAKSEKYTAKAQAALQESARHFNEAFDAAVSRYEK